jgi:hypothetical protein
MYVLSVLWYVCNHGLFCFCNLGFEKFAWRCSVPSISLVLCKVTVWLLTFNFIHFMAAFWAVFTYGGSGPALTAHGSLDLKQEIQIQISRLYACPNGMVWVVYPHCVGTKVLWSKVFCFSSFFFKVRWIQSVRLFHPLGAVFHLSPYSSLT